jgi:hypothetical protein
MMGNVGKRKAMMTENRVLVAGGAGARYQEYVVSELKKSICKH